MTTYAMIVEFGRMLANLERWIEKATEHAQKKSFDPALYLQFRLAPDQYAFVRQVQSACDAAKFAAAYLSGKQAPSNPDTESTIAEVQERIKVTRAYLDSFTEQDFSEAAQKKVSPRWLGGKYFQGNDYLQQVAVPNFFFHVTTAYAILRHNGVDLGKADFLGSLTIHEP